MNTSHRPDHCGPGYRYPTRVRDLAFQLWAFRCSRRLTCVAEELAALGAAEGWECVPGERTLRHWATKGDWAAATVRALRNIAPDLMEGLVTDLVMGAAEGMTYLREVLAGRVTQPNSTRIRAILTALSMVGVPDLVHATIRDAMRERDTALSVSVIAQTEAEPASLVAVKERIATSLGLIDQVALEHDGAVPVHGREDEGAHGRQPCSA